MTRHQRRFVQLASGLAIALATASCSTRSPDASTAGDPPRRVGQTYLPLAGYAPFDTHDRKVLLEAALVTLRPCLQRAGHPLSAGTADGSEPALAQGTIDDLQLEARWGTTDVRRAETEGYWRLRERHASTGTNGPIQPADASDPTGFAAALGTDGEPGCYRDMVASIGFDPSDPLTNPIGQIAVRTYSVVSASEDGAAALADWASCMAAAGYPGAVFADMSYDFDFSAPAGPAEIRQATAEARCDVDARMAARLGKPERKLQEHLSSKEVSLLMTTYREGRRRVAVAKKILANGS